MHCVCASIIWQDRTYVLGEHIYQGNAILLEHEVFEMIGSFSSC